ncbi:ribonucleoside-diphosphate reductase subunit alpha [Marinithermus hydrothermalis]|uniref:Ribonucleoside-diphosphate reductase n=1 Tax=Marinithermus hydrothermalis (strain DSM 14884 / JCM 11576 / T1) TaxID=869210 RepID=F2NP11_MARHT|nr:ribonucleoside-diphosphate reductase subunit alpha [Marinithermus hydrothermalis]AEB11599.1 ribonucleoside-diphosphate reductase, alpha subunit [Marinithermus hydrothermalis DSM 14884]
MNEARRLLNTLARPLGPAGEAARQLIAADLEALKGTGEAEAVLLAAATQNIHLEPAASQIAVRVLLRHNYREALGTPTPSPAAYRQGFIRYVQNAIREGYLDPRLGDLDLEALATTLRPERDAELPYAGLVALLDRYVVRDLVSGRVLETPQFLFMRVAMGLALAEAEPLAWIPRFYEAISRRRVLPSTPTLFNAGTPHPQLSSCYLWVIEDSLDAILDGLQTFGKLAKYAGGIGASLTKLRAKGAPVRGISGHSSGVIPFLNVYDALIQAVNQGGRRRGTMAAYLEPWHLEVEAFLDLRKNTGDPYLRVRRLNTALFVPDEFMRRVERGEAWYLFDPQVAPDLAETWGRAFDEAYARYIQAAEAGQLPPRSWKKLPARKLYREILAVLQETSHPWLVFKDAGNARSALAAVGMVHSSNLCTEIFLPTSQEEIAVCNLASLNLAAYLQRGRIQWRALAKSAHLAMRMLDNVIDQNLYPDPRAEQSNWNNRPVGLGIMGFSEVFSRLGLAYPDPEAYALTDRITEYVSYHAIQASALLARERGAFPRFPRTTWAQGRLPLDTLEDLERLRGAPVEVSREARLDWDALRPLVQKGMRNSTVMAIAPTASISLIAGTTPSLDPYYANVFSRNNLSGKFLEVNPVLVEALKRAGLWEEVRERIVEERGDLSEIEAIPEPLRRRFPTAYQIPPTAYIEHAARAQKWVDMGVSRNLYLQERSLEAMEAVYLEAWRKGLKSTYYLYVAPRMYAEQSTVRVNKARKRPKWRLEEMAFTPERPEIQDPSEDALCEGCQ